MKKSQTPPLCSVALKDPVLSSRFETDYRVTIPAAVNRCRETGRFEAFRLNWKPGMPNQPHIFWDSDVAKVLEGMAYMLELHPDDHALAQELDTLVDLILSAQQPDGYLNVVFTTQRPNDRFTNLFNCHELYCAGHLMEAAVAHFQATGNRKFLDGVCRYADYLRTVFGNEPGKRRGYPGHQEIELALCRLSAVTGNETYAELAEFFLNERGREPNYFVAEAERIGETRYPGDLENRQAHLPVREQTEPVGHAVRAVYLYTGMVDVAEQRNDPTLLAAVEKIFSNLIHHHMYLTGGIGAKAQGESFSKADFLPNASAYAESCAAMGLVQLAARLLNLTGNGQYADVMEQVLYNGALSGLSLSGDRFFYVNPQEVAGNFPGVGERQKWFGCSCCPTSYCRFLPQLGSFVWSELPDGCQLNIPAASQLNLHQISLSVGGCYPYGGEIPITVERGGEFRLRLRIPGFCASFSLRLNGEKLDLPVRDGFVELQRNWRKGDVLELSLVLDVVCVRSNPQVEQNAGKIALMRGPLVYALESVDNGNCLSALSIAADQPFHMTEIAGLPEGTLAIQGTARRQNFVPGDALYHCEKADVREVAFVAVPYALWQNRGPAEMAVWMREA